ncbi:hypothetical protein XENOCAPTIV_001586, partial [Xenoophorus captivus]
SAGSCIVYSQAAGGEVPFGCCVMVLLFITEPLSQGLIEQAAMRGSSFLFDVNCR